MNKDCYTCKFIDEKDEEIAALNELGQEVATDCAKKDKELSKLRRQLEEKEDEIERLKRLYAGMAENIALILRGQDHTFVRCEDCKFASEEGGYEYLGQADTHINCTKWLTQNHSKAIMPKDGFCSEGKRRSDCG